MKIIYTAPNRAHHYKYASSLNNGNLLRVFVSGFSRLSPRSKIEELKGQLYRADIIQTIYLLCLKIKLPKKICNYLAYLAKIEQDYACSKYMENADLFLFYNGSGLNSIKKAKKKGVITVVEVVNSHVDYQETLLKEEHERLNLKWTPFHQLEKKRRLKEYDAADYILLPSEFVKRSFLEKGFLEKKLIKVPYGFNKFNDVNNINHNTETPENECFNILYVGSISVRKGLRYLIEAFNKLEIKNKRLTLVGPIDVVSGIQDMEITDDIELRGVLKGDDLEEAYKSADVFCLPTIEDGFGLVLGEALSFGLPIITTVNSGGDELITEEQEGFIVPIRDSDAIYSKLYLLSSDSLLLNKMKLAAQKKANNLNGWEETGTMLCEELKKVILNH